ncbi:hypothetical protein BT67DRAFT_301202 [Trichocladium antarcticum]|uniref:Uncharacterized protein n=1 Tax=Trichocladium antarcticum TaxID=1450529 RepID=A0AAN6ZEC9_9PEZI|nr:hypothetical protein BT67DRAFT_301202 [Trichocladium antarcticum]
MSSEPEDLAKGSPLLPFTNYQLFFAGSVPVAHATDRPPFATGPTSIHVPKVWPCPQLVSNGCFLSFTCILQLTPNEIPIRTPLQTEPPVVKHRANQPTSKPPGSPAAWLVWIGPPDAMQPPMPIVLPNGQAATLRAAPPSILLLKHHQL